MSPKAANIEFHVKPYLKAELEDCAHGGELYKNKKDIEDSGRVEADPDISAAVNIHYYELLVPELQGKKPKYGFYRGWRNVSVQPGTTKTHPIEAEEYIVSAEGLYNPVDTVVVTAQISSTSLTVKPHTSTIKVGFDVQRYSAMYLMMDKTITTNYSGLTHEGVKVKVERHVNELGGKLSYLFRSRLPRTSKVHRKLLPANEVPSVDVGVDSITKNNLIYSFHTEGCPNHWFHTRQGRGGFSCGVLIPNGTVLVRLTSEETGFIYTKNVNVQDNDPYFSVPVQPGKYKVQAKNFIDKNHILHSIAFGQQLTVKNDPTTLTLTLDSKVDLNAVSFPAS
ncbi:uncharacterized protein ATNIH1004_006370 [Aspergillus tanneri]|uniref:Uncharacterized protein n=1 Tax=Aspergillus tanneri TaxID=1220188 RepID=A0A5M9MNZ9_9EURO|nr:uncharacterized protein ATNIH1004_006370 [Aspergillus tanneri]KAA8647676.1 hypothetical protein ATNIH1004_006370 [Aspergillus tanneri]